MALKRAAITRNKQLAGAFGVCIEEINKLRSENALLREALEWIKIRAADKRNPQISFVADKALKGESLSPLRKIKPELMK